jgi:hypothetical protein
VERLCEIALGFGSVLSRLFNVIVLQGSPDQTTSARAYIERHKRPWLYRLINALFFWMADHCKWSWAQEVAAARRTLEVNSRSEG